MMTVRVLKTGKRECFLLLGIVLAGAWLRLDGLGAKSLWVDETLAWRLTEFPLGEMLQRLNDSRVGDNPPLYFLVLRGWAALGGDSEVALRFPAAVFGLAAILGVYAFVRELARFDRPGSSGGSGAALLAAALVAFNVVQIYASRQVRMYSLGAALFAWGSWALLRALRPGVERRGVAWVLYGSLALTFCYTHNLGLFSTFAQAVFAAAYLYLGARPAAREMAGEVGPAAPAAPAETEPAPARSSRLRGQAAWAVAIALALVLGYLPGLLKLLDRSDKAVPNNSWMGQPTWQGVTRETANALGTPFMDSRSARDTAAWLVALGLLGILVFLAARAGWAGWYLLLTGLVPVLLMLAYSLHSGQSLIQFRYLTFAQVAWLAGLAVLVCRVPSVTGRSLLAGLALAWSFLSCQAGWDLISPSARPGMRGAIDYVLRHRASDERIVAQSQWTLIKSLYYTRGRARPLLYSNIPSRHLHPQAAYLKDEDLVTLGQLSAGASGAWFITTSSHGERAGVRFPLPGHWELDHTAQFYQDLPWESPLLVEYYRAPRAPNQGPSAETAGTQR